MINVLNKNYKLLKIQAKPLQNKYKKVNMILYINL